jgi:diamine N-acetyltransferase
MIIGKRVRLRGLERADLPVFVSWLNDPDVQQGIFVYWPISQAEEDGWFDEMIKLPIDQHILGIEIRLTNENKADAPESDPGENWKLIGDCGFTHIDWQNRSAEFGIAIGDKSYWNRGYGTEAVRLLVGYGFNTLNMNRIYLRVFENNPGAIRAYEKAGFVHEGRQRQAQFRDGKYIDVLVMSILRSEL